jgi:hypothetical protein
MIENSRILFWLSALLILSSGCVQTPEPDPVPRHLAVGIIRSVNLAERYVVFEAEFRVPPGREMRLLQNGLPAGRLRAGSYRRRKFQSADILEGRPRTGDLVEPTLPVQLQPAQQTQNGRLRP